MKNVTAFSSFTGLLYDIFQQLRYTPSLVCSFIAAVCLPWQRRYGCRTNAAAESSYERARSLAL